MKLSFLILLLTSVSLRGASHAEIRFAIAISNFDDTTIPKTPSAANGTPPSRRSYQVGV
jgi:hypothetical protein